MVIPIPRMVVSFVIPFLIGLCSGHGRGDRDNSIRAGIARDIRVGAGIGEGPVAISIGKC